MEGILMRVANDFYPTPYSIAELLIKDVESMGTNIWEPCAGDGRLVNMMREKGMTVYSGDICFGQNFFEYKEAKAPVLVTNPPFKDIRKFIDHAFKIGIEQMALIVPERIWASKVGMEQFNRHRPSKFINMSWREDYLGKGGSPDRALAASFWTSPCANQTTFDVWSKP